MWTLCHFDSRAFNPNHFVPLFRTRSDNIFVTVAHEVDIDRTCFNDDSYNEFNVTLTIVVDDDDDDDREGENDDHYHGYGGDHDDYGENHSYDHDGDDHDNYGDDHNHGQDGDVDQSLLMSGDKTLSNLASKYDCVIKLAKAGPADTVIHVDENYEKNSANYSEKTTDVEVGNVGILEKKFLETNKVIDLLTNTVKGINKIPPGLKSNVYFVMINGDNTHKRI
ncbi:hypothetical protein DPMN_004796 [Dreissena polymorpha]|uniref:Uncharacterized protein n=1 Tax=Dreissena polymorpha TaxID=45954 RepID=A0A9D4RTV6_DREPO|nr:hypothetical protein DPMN_004796 [Dreissena polymorpha]